jgi:[acyl-carrier-protein] S-malonyltransferase
MGRDLAEADSGIMDLWKKAERASGFALREIYWDGDEKNMAATQYLQPALTVVNLALWSRLASRVTPMAAAGHSLGEYSALAAAGVLSPDTVLELVSLRGKLMADCDPEGRGAMAAIVKLALPQVEECVAKAAAQSGKTLVVANYNTPAQFVVSGDKDAVEQIQPLVKEQKGRALPLAVSGAFHSPLMQEASAELKKALDLVKKSEWNKARFPIYSNATATAETDAHMLKTALERQMTSSVLWIDTIRSGWAGGAGNFVECGPKGVLGKMVDPVLQGHVPAQSDETPPWSVQNVGNKEQLEAFSA